MKRARSSSPPHQVRQSAARLTVSHTTPPATPIKMSKEEALATVPCAPIRPDTVLVPITEGDFTVIAPPAEINLLDDIEN